MVRYWKKRLKEVRVRVRFRYWKKRLKEVRVRIRVRVRAASPELTCLWQLEARIE